MYTISQNLANFGLTCVPKKGRGFITVRAVTAYLVSKDARDFKEKSHETARLDLLALRTYRVKRLGGADFRVKLTFVKPALFSLGYDHYASARMTASQVNHQIILLLKRSLTQY